MAAPRVLPDRARPLIVGGLALCYLAALLLPRAQASPGIFWSVTASAAALLTWIGALAWGARRRGERLRVEFTPRKPHLVQIVMHSSVFAYWGWHWELVYPQIPLIVTQVAFAYLLDLALSWQRYKCFRLGFGQWPIIGSTNLFLWFKDDWFALQLGMIAIAYLAREWVQWERAGRKVHVFNPSAIGLSVAAVGLILSQQVHHTWGPEISTTLGYGPYAFEQIFLAGVVVQLFFAVGLVTASAAISMVLLGLAWYAATDQWLFVDTAIPIAVFLGMTLLVTDPVSSPYTDGGKLAFGVLYSVGVMALYLLLRPLERIPGPTDPGLAVSFFDKVLLVPVMNLGVRRIDRWFGKVPVRAWTDRLVRRLWPRARPALSGPDALYAGGGLAHRVTHVLMWGGAFVAIRPQLVAHPGLEPAFWQARCSPEDPTACENWRRVLRDTCQAGSGESCHNLGVIYEFGERVPADRWQAGVYYDLGCERGALEACNHLGGLLMTDGVADAHATARALFERACTGGRPGACTRLGVMTLDGQGGPADPVAGRAALERACAAGDGQGCDQLGQRSPGPAARAWFERACEAGYPPACARLRTP